MKREIFNLIVDEIASVFRLNKEDMFIKSKRRDLVDARYMLYLICTNRNMNVKYIQDYMNELGYETAHSPIIHGIQSARNKSNEDPDYRYIVDKISRSVDEKIYF